MKRFVPSVLVIIVTTIFMVPTVQALGLTFEERVQAQQALERVSYSHQIGATRPFEEALPRDVLERRVRQYLRQSAALEEIWQTPVTAEALYGELERMARNTRMPDRLREMYAALDDDPVLILECLARPRLVDRLVRSFFAGDRRFHASYEDWWSEVRENLNASSVPQVALSDAPLPSPKGSQPSSAGASCVPDDVWDNGSLMSPAPMGYHRAVWTGSLMLVWGGGLQVGEGWRYDPAADSWAPISTVDAPEGRNLHTAVWTGDEMIVWGGGRAPSPEAFSNGGRYDPLTDTWTPTSDVNAPSARIEHTAVWTGDEMIVWGGYEDGAPSFNSGGRYDPQTDSWTPTSTTGPTSRSSHTAVWTGDEMIVWGGIESGGFTSTGWRYDPQLDTWAPVSTTNVPAGRVLHTVVWSGTEMIVWGGSGGGTFDSGGRYDPAADTWIAVSTVNAPSARRYHTAVWSGNRMIVWGGEDGAGGYFDSGGSYAPATDTWTTTPTLNAPSARYAHTAVWTGSLMIVWGADFGDNTGGRYDPGTDAWTPTNSTSAPAPQSSPPVWTGNEMILWGQGGQGGRYNPVTDSWTSTSTASAPDGRSGHSAIWTGSEMIVWGGGLPPGLSSGGRYDPLKDSWAPTSIADAPSARFGHTAVWTGSEMIVWGGSFGSLDTGGLYDPATDTWTPTSTFHAPAGRSGHTAIWTGTEMILWGGGGAPFDTGGRYDPATDAWLPPTSLTNAPSPRSGHTAVWTGSEMIVWGGSEFFDGPVLDSGGRYDPLTNTWISTSPIGTPSARQAHTAVWTGSEMIVWGGSVSAFDGPLFGSGGRYDPLANTWMPTSELAAPSARDRHGAVWTGGLMIVWGGSGNHALDNGGRYALENSVDNDGDGLSECDGDCNDADPGAFAAPQEVTGLVLAGDKQTLMWNSAAPSAGSGTVHDMIRGTLDAPGVGSGEVCLGSISGNAAVDLDTPGANEGFWYLVRGRNTCGSGTYGQTSAAVERVTTVCP